MSQKLRLFIPIFVTITGILGVVYIVAQQNIRQSANEQQIQLSEDMAMALSSGANPKEMLPPFKVDIERSLTPFVIIFNDQDKVVSSTAMLRGKTPDLPDGVLEYAREHGQSRITWEPLDRVRSAIVVTRANNGFVLAGRSLQETEKLENMLFWEVFSGWVAVNAAALISIFLFIPASRKK